MLATEATRWIHGQAAAEAAAETARRTFEEGAGGAGLPTHSVARSVLDAGYPLFDAFLAAQLVTSKSEARRHLAAHALRINNEVIDHGPAADGCRPGGRRHQAVGGQEEARADQAGVGRRDRRLRAGAAAGQWVEDCLFFALRATSGAGIAQW